jgi:hypothetical protein
LTIENRIIPIEQEPILMRHLLPVPFLVVLLFIGSLSAKSCGNNIGHFVYVNPEFDKAAVYWFAPGGYPVLYEEVRYSSRPFNPNTGGGALIRPIYDLYVELRDSKVTMEQSISGY